jgi:hypothetical protein
MPAANAAHVRSGVRRGLVRAARGDTSALIHIGTVHDIAWDAVLSGRCSGGGCGGGGGVEGRGVVGIAQTGLWRTGTLRIGDWRRRIVCTRS